MTTLSAAIKKELKKAFPGIKFSVTTRNDDVTVKWELPLGTDATVAAVKAICEKHETVVHHGDLMNDTAWSSGSSVYENPSYTQERKDWALEQTKARNFAGVTWNERHQRFEEADGRDAYHATKQYHEYLQNGVSCALINEYGGEPSDKFWYYERLKEEQAKLNPSTPQPEPEQVESEIEAPIVPLRVYKIENEVYIQANFPSGNKRQWIDEYRSQPTNVCQAKIVKVVHLTPEDYQRFIYSFLNDQEWLAGEGGSGSHYVSEKYGNDWDKLFSDELETEKWRRECYELSVLVTDGKEYVLANPEGHNYARYVGLPHERTLEFIIGKTNLKLATASPEPNAISQLGTQAEEPQPETEVKMFDAEDVALCIKDSAAPIAPATPETNLIPFPSPKQPEPQPVAQPQSNDGDSFYLQNYQAWVNKLVARGEYGKIKSFEEWYAIAVEVM